MDSQYSGSLVGDDYSKILWETTPKTENRSECCGSKEKQSTITTENNSKEETDRWNALIDDAASKVRTQYDDILNSLLIEGCDESEAKVEAFAQILLVFQNELADVYVGNLR